MKSEALFFGENGKKKAIKSKILVKHILFSAWK